MRVSLSLSDLIFCEALPQEHLANVIIEPSALSVTSFSGHATKLHSHHDRHHDNRAEQQNGYSLQCWEKGVHDDHASSAEASGGRRAGAFASPIGHRNRR